MDKDLEVIAIFGARGSGKTVRCKKLLGERKRKRVIVYDLKDEYPFTKVRGATELGKFFKKNWRKSFKVSYVPSAKEKAEHIAELSKVCYAIAKAQKADAQSNLAQNITILVEEMSVSAPNQKYPAGQGGFEFVVNIAREWGVEVIGVSQRPAQANPDFRGNATRSFFYNLSNTLDIKALKGMIGDDANNLKSLQPHEYFEFHRGTIKKGKNKLK